MLESCADGPLRYTPALDDARQSWTPVLEYMQQLAREYGLLKGSLSPEGQLWLDNQAFLLGEVTGHLARQEQILLAQNIQSTNLARRQEAHSRDLTERLAQQLIERVQHQLRQTWTWRAGRITLAPLRLGRKLWRRFRRAG